MHAHTYNITYIILLIIYSVNKLFQTPTLVLRETKILLVIDLRKWLTVLICVKKFSFNATRH